MTEDVLQGSLTLRAMAAAASTAWRGLSLQNSDNFAYPDTTGAAAIPLNLVIAETDGIYNGTDGGIVPVGMAGLWRVGGMANTEVPGGVMGGHGSVFIAVNGVPSGAICQQGYYGFDTVVYYLTFSLSPIVVVLFEGDEVQLMAGSSGGGAPEVSDGTAFMLMEYLGPAPEVS